MTNVDCTQYGIPYQKTSSGKKVGFTAGAVAGGVAGYKFMQEMLQNDIFVNKLADRLIDKAGPNVNPEIFYRGFNKLFKNLPKCSLVAGATVIGGIGLAIGALVDKAVNFTAINNRQ